jgi:hypothetical protein
LNIARQQAEFEIDKREDLVRVEDQPQQSWVGWAASWFGGGGGAHKAQTETDAKIMEKLEQEVTPEEKQRLFDAIDYQVIFFRIPIPVYNPLLCFYRKIHRQQIIQNTLLKINSIWHCPLLLSLWRTCWKFVLRIYQPNLNNVHQLMQ